MTSWQQAGLGAGAGAAHTRTVQGAYGQSLAGPTWLLVLFPPPAQKGAA